MGSSKKAATTAEARLACIRAAGITEYEGEIPGWGVVKLKLAPLAPGVTGKVVGPAPARPPSTVPKELEDAGVDADQLAEAQARAALLFPS